ncbi:MAG: 6-carboxytetrahydropterin synthase [Candidatus Ozemobacter sibiricus]|uniref:6-carboxy-5,6,7,8-tetrahydropterin synthase n=1 Tax=Candidatus Ozemobacter sibiricus TaxID=2268124 RepID=A0A367ZKI6_9BACT|nr:MAG: 6-carboxytetrahydropterin synthase [Candidatus Ozemobacter sibiricus]
MYRISVEKSFSAAHLLPDHPGKCRQLHGHNWRVRVTAAAATLDQQGMVVDFSVLKRALAEVCDQFDHRLLNELPLLAGVVPTAEHLCRIIHGELARRLDDGRVRIALVQIWETPDNCAEFVPAGGGEGQP